MKYDLISGHIPNLIRDGKGAPPGAADIVTGDVVAVVLERDHVEDLVNGYCAQVPWSSITGLLRPVAPQARGLPYGPGDFVRKVSGYPFDGPVLAVCTTTAGAIRVVVENGDGMLHIFADHQLELDPTARVRFEARKAAR